jgi:YD repeat-containing protein
VLHRVTGKGYGAQSCPLATPVVTYVYDSGTNAIGHLTSLIDQAGTASYTYDIMGRLASETRQIAGVSKSTSYTYNLDGSVKTLTYPSGRVVTYTPDSAGRVISAADGKWDKLRDIGQLQSGWIAQRTREWQHSSFDQQLPIHTAPTALPHYHDHFCKNSSVSGSTITSFFPSSWNVLIEWLSSKVSGSITVAIRYINSKAFRGYGMSSAYRQHERSGHLPRRRTIPALWSILQPRRLGGCK